MRQQQRKGYGKGGMFRNTANRDLVERVKRIKKYRAEQAEEVRVENGNRG